jgi:hypothetical protein
MSESDDIAAKSDGLRDYEESKKDLNVNAVIKRRAKEELLAEEERLAKEAAKNSTSR